VGGPAPPVTAVWCAGCGSPGARLIADSPPGCSSAGIGGAGLGASAGDAAGEAVGVLGAEERRTTLLKYVDIKACAVGSRSLQ
jgi:hypothetical protein